MNQSVTMEVMAKKLPEPNEWAVFMGLEEALTLLEGLPVTVRALPEGTFFHPFQPVLSLEGKYLDFGQMETTILGFLCQASGITTKAARCRLKAGQKTMISFGIRRMHPAIAPMVDRSAYVGGCDGVAAVASARRLGLEPSGTIPHALILLMGDTVEATRAFDEIMPPEVMRVSLIDTFQDEKFEAVAVAEALGERLYAVRLDTAGSRRGNFADIIKEVRWELDVRGYDHVKIFVSGGINEETIEELYPLVDAFGVGTAISCARGVDYSMDIVEIDGRVVAKRGKMSGAKSFYRCHHCHSDRITLKAAPVPACPGCGEPMEDMMRTVMESGRITCELPSAKEIREYVLRQLEEKR